MRMWMLPVSKMCRKHLLGEHIECHMIKGCMKKGISLNGYLEKRIIEPKSLKKRHDMISREMKKRGYKHMTPLGHVKHASRISVNRKKSLQDIRLRCKECEF